MGTASRGGGLYYVNGKAVDGNGQPVHDAPPMPTPVVAAPVVPKTLAQEIAEAIVLANASMVQPLAMAEAIEIDSLEDRIAEGVARGIANAEATRLAAESAAKKPADPKDKK